MVFVINTSIGEPMSNPEERACYRIEGPDCKHLPGCDRLGTAKFLGIVNCQYYEPAPFLKEAIEKIMNDKHVEDFEKRMAREYQLVYYSALVTLAALILFIWWIS